MMYGDRNDMRQFFVDVFNKQRAQAVLSPLESIVAEIIAAHPEYHSLLEKGNIDDNYTVERGDTNPFLHMAMHIAIREQVQTDRPTGIRNAWQELISRHGDPHAAEHAMLEVLGDTLATAQRNNTVPDEQAYLEAVRRL